MKLTPFHDIHVQLGAKMVEFAGFHMPIQYKGIISEHKRVRESVGVFDVTHMGEFEVHGRDAFDFVQYMTTNDVGKLEKGRVQYSTMCYEHGGIVDDLLVYHCGDYLQLVVNASNLAKDYAWLRDHLKGDVQLVDRSDDTALLAVQGPRSADVLRKLTDVPVDEMNYYSFRSGKVAGIDCLVSRTGYTGELGFELYFKADPDPGRRIWEALFESGAEFDIEAIGLGARDTLRLEAGFCLYGNDIDQTTLPPEARLGWITKLEKGEFIGRDAIVKAKEAGLKRTLVGLTVEGRAIPRQGYEISVGGTVCGHVTSGTKSPMLDIGIAMGYVPKEHSAEGTVVDILIRNQAVPAKVVRVPFIKK
jgi:aminomethyltransferase